MFRDQTQSIARRYKRTSKAGKVTAAVHTPQETSTSQGSIVEPSTTLPPSPSSLMKDPAISEEKLDIPCAEQSLSLFFYQYVYEGRDGPGFNGFLPLYYEQAQPNSCLKHCVTATAFASLANQSNSAAISRLAVKYYGEALASVNAALSDPVESLKDETLAALFILGMFENISALQCNIFGVHGEGMDRLLEYRNKHNPMGSEGKIADAVCRYLQIRKLTLRQRPSQEDEDRVLRFDYPDAYRLSVLSSNRICHAMVDTDELLATIDSNAPAGNSTITERCRALSALVAKMQTIQRNHWVWVNDLPRSWNFVSIDTSHIQNHSTNTIHIYPSLWVANFWNYSRVCCIILHLSILQCLRKLSSISDRTPSHAILEAESRSTIQTMTQEICATIPYIMCDIDSSGNPVNPLLSPAPVGQSMAQLWLLWCFHIMLASGFIPPRQMGLVRDAIRRIGYEKGIGQALLGEAVRS